MKSQYEVKTTVNRNEVSFFVEAFDANAATARACKIINQDTVVEGQEWSITHVDSGALMKRIVAEWCSSHRRVVLRKTAVV